MLKIGIDIGSTTIKVAAVDKDQKLIWSVYRRHHTEIVKSVIDVLTELTTAIGDQKIVMAFTGSGSMGLAKALNLPFFQEVVCEIKAAEIIERNADVIIELGGEDAKVVFLKPNPDARMNTACAGGTGAFIDQMASLLQTDAIGLNDLASRAQKTLDLAARCGVFAKTDLQALLNDGAAKEDIAKSVLQAVTNQTIGGLAQGREIKGEVIFLGGPLFYCDQLRNCFQETLQLKNEQMICPTNAHLVVALGAAFKAQVDESKPVLTLKKLEQRLKKLEEKALNTTKSLMPLFADQVELQAFRKRHLQAQAKKGELGKQKKSAKFFLGFDAGSTTSKLVLINELNEIIYSDYTTNAGDPLVAAQTMLTKMWQQLGQRKITYSAVTGYGEALLLAALGFDEGEVETICHFTAAKEFCPEVSFLIDIGGQDMKAMRIEKGVIEDILLNEACSSGCGSFISTLAQSLNLSVAEFAAQALTSQNPVDLGYRCTVFMNTSIKQAQKEGAKTADIAAGLAQAVIRNALYKVMQYKNAQSLGKAIVVQGGTFKNEAVLRALEKETQTEVICPDVAEVMGAYGAALIAKEKWQKQKIKTSKLFNIDELSQLTRQQFSYRCQGCDNHCQLMVSIFNDGRRFTSGNRCEKGAGLPSVPVEKRLPNLYEEREKLLFGHYEAQQKLSKVAKRGKIGIPRALNIGYEHFPLWYQFLTDLGFKVVLSPKSNKKLYNDGLPTLTSEAICYPAKMANAHINWLINQDLQAIFYPAIVYEPEKVEGANNSFNCPIVTGYPEVVKNGFQVFKTGKMKLVMPFLNLADQKSMVKELQVALSDWSIDAQEIAKALKHGYQVWEDFKQKQRQQGELVLKWLKDNPDKRAIVLAGRPYHSDPEVNHGLAKILINEGLAVVTEDSIAHLGKIPRPLRVLDQWAFHTRVYAAASVVAVTDRLDLVQINSFGCGLDAIVADQAKEIIQANGKIYTLLKIDEGSNLGAIRIRLRSLKSALLNRELSTNHEVKYSYQKLPVFDQEKRRKCQILAPQMAPLQFGLCEAAFGASGYQVKVLPAVTTKDIEVGLKYVNNDACYPAILTVGQIINAFKTGQYDPENTAVMMTQTGGACRASNYVGLIKKALHDANLSQVSLISINPMGWEKQPGFKLTIPLLNRTIMAVILGDLLVRLSYRQLPREKNLGETQALTQKYHDLAKQVVSKGKLSAFQQLVKKMVTDFYQLPTKDQKIHQVGLVGEILVKFHPDANHHLVEFLQKKKLEVVLPDLMDFFLYSTYNNVFKSEHLGAAKWTKWSGLAVKNIVELYREPVRRALQIEGKGWFGQLARIEQLAELAKPVISPGMCSGEGWFLTAEILELLENGVNNVLCLQPFACLPNHIVGRGMLGTLRERYNQANLMALDFDPGTSKVANENRLELFLDNCR